MGIPLRSNPRHSVRNRIRAVMAHTVRYAFKGQARLAADTGVSEAAISRLIHGLSNPSYEVVFAVTVALEKALGKPIGSRELVSFDGRYPTSSVCELAGCRGCLPAEAFDEQDRLRPEFQGAVPGQWSVSSSPISQPNQPITHKEVS